MVGGVGGSGLRRLADDRLLHVLHQVFLLGLAREHKVRHFLLETDQQRGQVIVELKRRSSTTRYINNAHSYQH